MISEERLKELIEQRAKIYVVHKIGLYIQEINLDNNCSTDGKFLVTAKDYGALFIPLDKLYETKEQAEWARDFQRIERTEYLDLPSWEELQPKIKDLEAHHSYLIAFNSRFAMEYENGFIDQICLYQNQPPYESWNWNAGKESYIKACEMAKRLFLGEEGK